MALDKCPTCSYELIEKELTKLLSGGSHTASMKVKAKVCHHCGQRLYSEDTVKRCEEIRRKLSCGDTAGFKVLGQSFQVV